MKITSSLLDNKTIKEEWETYGLIPTLNKKGYMKRDLCQYSHSFVQFSASCTLPVLEIGCAYGIASLGALEAGAVVISNDIEDKHLNILKENIPSQHLKNSILIPGKFPNNLNFSENSLGAILASRVFNYLTGSEIEQALKICYKWLMPGGKIFLICETPYKKMFENFVPTYEARKKTHLRWPGEIEALSSYTSHRLEHLPEFLHLIEESTLVKEIRSVGFKIESSSSFSKVKLSPDAIGDGQETAGIIGIK